jgi:hypothetical protein
MHACMARQLVFMQWIYVDPNTRQLVLHVMIFAFYMEQDLK